MTQKYSKDEYAIRALSPEQFYITQENGTERPYTGEYNDHYEEGIYADIVSGEPLFSSHDKFRSGCGWPSFSKPLVKDHVAEKQDYSHGMSRIEVRSKYGDSHLGHVFNDGPQSKGGLRYCINSASLKFVPKNEMTDQGYEEFLYLFETDGEEKTMTNTEKAILAGGCFWGVEDLIRKLPGVLETQVGYTGGKAENPKYPEVKTGETGHAEAIEIVFDPKRISFRALLEFFFQMHDPSTTNRQGNDIGSQYRSEIFAVTEEQAKIAEEVIADVDTSGKWPGLKLANFTMLKNITRITWKRMLAATPVTGSDPNGRYPINLK